MTGVTPLLFNVTEWAKAQPSVIAVALVGSHARGQAREDSDVDLLVICQDPSRFLQKRDWPQAFGRPLRQTIEDWGKVTSLRVFYEDGSEVEFGLAPAEWGSDPSDQGDAGVVASGIQVLYEEGGVLTSRLAAFGRRAG